MTSNEEEQPVDHSVWPPEASDQKDYRLGYPKVDPSGSGGKVGLTPIFGLMLPVAVAEAMIRVCFWLSPSGGFESQSTARILAIGSVVLSKGCYPVYFTGVVPILVLALLMWRSRPPFSLCLIAGILLGFVWFHFRTGMMPI